MTNFWQSLTKWPPFLTTFYQNLHFFFKFLVQNVSKFKFYNKKLAQICLISTVDIPFSGLLTEWPHSSGKNLSSKSTSAFKLLFKYTHHFQSWKLAWPIVRLHVSKLNGDKLHQLVKIHLELLTLPPSCQWPVDNLLIFVKHANHKPACLRVKWWPIAIGQSTLELLSCYLTTVICIHSLKK